MLTCKSLFGLGYRGERLIEPLFKCFVQATNRWLRVGAHEQGSASRLPVGKTVKVRGHVDRGHR